MKRDKKLAKREFGWCYTLMKQNYVYNVTDTVQVNARLCSPI